MSFPSFKKIIKALFLPCYLVFNIFYSPFLRNYFFSRIEKIPRSKQLFFMTRFDYGTWLLLMHYVQCWCSERGPAALVVFIPNSQRIVHLAKWICPHAELVVFDNWLSRLVFKIFRSDVPQYYTYNPIYAEACCLWPYALYIFDMTFCRKNPVNISRYVEAFDPVLQKPWPFSDPFLQTYLHTQKGYDYRRDIYQDMIRLTYARAERKIEPPLASSFFHSLLQQLKIETPYVVMNLNCKDYRNKLRNNRRINFPERYNPMIDFLISKGYSVVMQGREEQPLLPQRKGLINYFNSSFASEENDYGLFSQCAFAIFPKTGPEVFGPICNIPVLGLNYTELAAIVPKSRCRFFPKHVWDSKKGAFIHWKDLLQRPCFFDVGVLSFEEGIEYIDLDEEELLQAAQEFLSLLPKPVPAWLEYTPQQEQFKRSLHPAHIDLYDVTEVPCDAYLSSPKYG